MRKNQRKSKKSPSKTRKSSRFIPTSDSQKSNVQNQNPHDIKESENEAFTSIMISVIDRLHERNQNRKPQLLFFIKHGMILTLKFKVFEHTEAELLTFYIC